MKMSDVDWIQGGMFLVAGAALAIGGYYGYNRFLVKDPETAEKKSDDKDEPAKEPEKKAIT